MTARAQIARFRQRAGRWAKNVAIALDQLANAVAGGLPDETLSSRAHKARERWTANIDTPADRRAYLWGCVLCGLLDALFRNHCADSVERDERK
jgi:hypothetical protein